MTVATYALTVDGAAALAAALARTPITVTRGRDEVRTLAPPLAGAASFELDNRSGAYNPSVATALRGTAVALTATYATVPYPLWTGILDQPVQHPFGPLPSVSMSALGTLSRLAAKKNLNTALYASILVSDALDVLLDAAGWPALERDIEASNTTLLYWWLDGQDAFTAMLQLLNAEGPGASIYEDGSGYFVFRNRRSLSLDARSSVVQASYGTGFLPVHPPVEYDDGVRDVINQAAIKVNARTADALAVVWANAPAQTLTLLAGQTLTAVARHTTGAPFQAAVAPVDATDYQVDSGSITSAVLDRTSGASATISYTAGAAGAVISGLQLRAELVPVTSEITVTNSIDAAASIAQYGLRPWQQDTWPELAVTDARNFVNAVVGWYKDGRARYTFRAIGNVSAAAMTSALSREIGDLVRIVDPAVSLDIEAWIWTIEHEIVNGGTPHNTTFGCEQSLGNVYGLWGTGLWGVSLWGF